MKTIFQMGLGQRHTFGSTLRGPWLGQQEPSGGLPRSQRDDLVSQIQAASDKMTTVNTWSQAHPNPGAADLGNDLQAYKDQMSNLNISSAQVASVYQKMGPEQTSYDIAASDLNAIPIWTSAVNALYDIVSRHQGAQATTPGIRPGATAPLAPASGTSPLLVGGGIAAGLVVLALVLK